MIGWIVRNIISKETNVVLKIYKTIRPQIEYCTQAWFPRKLECNNEIGRHTKKRDKTNKKSKRLQLQREFRRIRTNYFTRKKE